MSPLKLLLQAIDLIIRERSTVALQFPFKPQSRLIIVGVNGRVGVGILALTAGYISIRLRFWRWRLRKKKERITNLINSVPVVGEMDSPIRYKMHDYVVNCA